jgi:hypothetical protein
VSRVGQRLARAWDPPWWTFDAFLVALALGSLVASFALTPGDDPRWVYYAWNGERFGDTCAFLAATGLPCPQCGMTRAWVHGARGHLVTSFLSSPGGFGLFFWLQVAAALAAWRLFKRDPFAVSMPWRVTVGWTAFWMFGLYLGPWILRLFGINPLP